MTPSSPAHSQSSLPASSSGEQEETPIQVTEAQVIEALTHGEIQEQGLLPYSSNHSFLITVGDDRLVLPAVYKPRRGESPLWDFEWGTLCLRETAAYTISSALEWDLVPPTVLRDGTRGLGSVQLYIPNDDAEHYFTVQDDARFALALRRLALFDYVINNADRKSGHCLIGDDGRMWAIDHGICFHTEYKLRTVIWEFSNEPIDSELGDDLEELLKQLTDQESALSVALWQLLNSAEYAALTDRTRVLLGTQKFPAPAVHRRNYPWPPV